MVASRRGWIKKKNLKKKEKTAPSVDRGYRGVVSRARGGGEGFGYNTYTTRFTINRATVVSFL